MGINYSSPDNSAAVTDHAALLTGTHGEINTTVASDQTVNNSTTLVNITALVAALAINSTYIFTQITSYTTSAVADFKWTWTSPAGSTIYVACVDGVEGVIRGIQSSGSAQSLASNGNGGVIMSTGIVKTGATAGNLQPQFAQNTAEVSDTIVRAGSSLWVKKVA